MMESVQIIWKDLVSENRIESEMINQLWLEIVNAYSLAGRHYHTMQHIEQMLKSSLKYSGNILDNNNLQLAVIYHDVVYLATKNDNEEKSANFAKNHLEQLNFTKEAIKKCCNYILATKAHENNTKERDLDYLLDFDLEILGAPWDEYEAYSKQIRLEYQIYPKLLYNKGRKKVLTSFLNQPKIFRTEIFYQLYEKKARNNLKKELSII
ncbi:MAG: hypothetical protein P1P88_02435 [Bacteroidales bacterium]|nr:hypothetical protein [Bacteroidales bacterium]